MTNSQQSLRIAMTRFDFFKFWTPESGAQKWFQKDLSDDKFLKRVSTRKRFPQPNKAKLFFNKLYKNKKLKISSDAWEINFILKCSDRHPNYDHPKWSIRLLRMRSRLDRSKGDSKLGSSYVWKQHSKLC